MDGFMVLFSCGPCRLPEDNICFRVHHVQRSFALVTISYAYGMSNLDSIEIRHLMALRSVATEGSFGRAADSLGYTQSAVSQQIAGLERIVGEKMFDRPGGPKPVALTPVGRMLLSHADAIADRLDAAETELAGYRAGTEGTLAVGTFQSVSVRLLPAVLQRFRIDRPRVQIQLYELDEQDLLLEKLADGSLDVSFLVDPYVGDDLETRHLCDDPFVLLSPPSSGLSGDGDETVSAGLLSGAPLLSQGNTACQRLIDDGLRGLGIDLNIVFRTNDNAAVQALVRAGVGHAVMPLMAVEPDDSQVVFRTLAPNLPDRRIDIALPLTREVSAAARHFFDLAAEVTGATHPAAATV